MRTDKSPVTEEAVEAAYRVLWEHGWASHYRCGWSDGPLGLRTVPDARAHVWQGMGRTSVGARRHHRRLSRELWAVVMSSPIYATLALESPLDTLMALAASQVAVTPADRALIAADVFMASARGLVDAA